MTPNIIRLARGEISTCIPLGRLPREYARQLGVDDRWVRFSPYSLGKQQSRHPDFTLDRYEDIDWMLANGELVEDPDERVIHIVADTRPAYGRRTKLTVKRSGDRAALFLISAHLIRDRDYERMQRRARGPRR